MEQHEQRERSPWTRDEEEMLRDYVIRHGPHHWDTIARTLDMGRSGNSCRLKWFNYLKPGIVRTEFTDEDILMILKLRYEGNGWSKIAKKMPGRTENHIKNFCNSRRMKKEAEQLNCDIKSEEFLNKMTAKLTERIQAAAYSMGGSGVATDTLMASGGAVDCCTESSSAKELSGHGSIGSTSYADQDYTDEFMQSLVPICDIIDNDFLF